jgi:DNA ligase-1
MSTADMTSDQVFRAIEKIAATPGRNDKEALVNTFLMFPTFKRVCLSAYEPLTTYGIEEVPERDALYAKGESQFGELVWGMLLNLAERRLTGNEAREEVHKWMQLLTAESAELLKRIIKKDLRAGFTDGTINRVAPGTVSEFPYMRCSLVKDVKLEAWPWVEGVISQEKADGQFANVDHDIDGYVRISSRAGTPMPLEELGDLVVGIRAVLKPGHQTHGELLVFQGDTVLPREQGNGILNSLAQGAALEPTYRIMFFAWDQIPQYAAKAKGKFAVGYKARLTDLVRQVKNAPNGPVRVIPTRIVKSLAEAYAHYRELLAKGKEGTIIAHPAGIWKDSTSRDKIKLKLEFVVDLKPIGFTEGKGKNKATFGAITCQTACGALQVDVSGMTDKVRKWMHEHRDEVLAGILAVKANSIMTNDDKLHSLFLPRYVELRKDKTVADTFEQVKAQVEAAMIGAAIAEAA